MAESVFQALKTALTSSPVLRNHIRNGPRSHAVTGHWGRVTPDCLHLLEADSYRAKVCSGRARNPCHQMSHWGALLLFGRQAFHPGYRPCPFPVASQGKNTGKEPATAMQTTSPDGKYSRSSFLQWAAWSWGRGNVEMTGQQPFSLYLQALLPV